VAGYDLRISASAAKELDALPRKKDRQAVVSRILALAEEPRPPGCVKLSGVGDLFRVRQGRYRIVYTIEDDRLVVVVVRIADRKEVYRKARRAGSPQRTWPFRSRR
jgi:mRNA interferase RelE/StbE